MNERIKELALQAGLGDHLWLDIPESEDVQVTEKFAELIVRECATVIQAQNDNENELDGWDRGFVAGLANAIEAIEQHFGVKE